VAAQSPGQVGYNVVCPYPPRKLSSLLLVNQQKKAVWLRSLLSEILGVSNGSTPLLCDNEGAIRLVKNPEFHQRTKHIDIKYHFIREKHQDKEIEIVYTSTENQLPDDLFTKPLPTPRFNQLRKQIGVEPL
jgi:hypothetical protein